MGRGNWHPCNNRDRYDLRYFNLFNRYRTESSDWSTYLWDVFVEEIERALPDSFWQTSRCEFIPYSRDSNVLFCNELVAIVIDSEADPYHVGVAMVAQESSGRFEDQYVDNFAPRYLRKEAPKLWKRIGGEQRVRTSAWTSSRVI